MRTPRMLRVGVAVALALALAGGACGRIRTPTSVEPTGEPRTPSPTAPPPTTPPPDPNAFVAGGGRIENGSAQVSPPPPVRVTPTPDPAIWRWEGVVVDEDGDPLPGVCVIIGPHGCVTGSIRTDGDGRYWIDMPQKTTVLYDLFFAKDGYQVVWYRAQPQGPTQFNVVLRKT